MTITTDGVGKKYLGDYLYGNHSLNYPNNDYVLCYDLFANGPTQFNTDIGTMLTALGTTYSITGTYEFLNGNNWYIDWAGSGDSTANSGTRFRLGWNIISNRYVRADLQGFDDSGTEVLGVKNGVYNLNPDYGNFLMTDNADQYFKPQISMSASTNHICLYTRVQRTDLPTQYYDSLLYAGYLQDINPSFGYYTSTQINSCFVMLKTYQNIWAGWQYVSPDNKLILETGDSNYPIVCSDAQVPDTDWLTDWYVFEDNESLGYPAIGRVPDILVSNSVYSNLGQPLKITGGTTPDGGSNKWVPVGVFCGKTIFIRVHSSFTAT